MCFDVKLHQKVCLTIASLNSFSLAKANRTMRKRRKKRAKKKKGPAAAKPKTRLDEEKEEIEQMQKALNSDWMSFSLSSSPWIRFSVSPEIEAAFSSDVGASEPEKKQVTEVQDSVYAC